MILIVYDYFTIIFNYIPNSIYLTGIDNICTTVIQY